jgi:hypothetical protein
MSKKVTEKMLKQLIEEIIRGDLPEQQPLPIEKPPSEVKRPPIKARTRKDIPKAWGNDERNISIDLDDFDFRSEEEIFTEQVRFKWLQFTKSLSQREQSVLRGLLGLDVKRYTVEELEKLQGALKGKSTK